MFTDMALWKRWQNLEFIVDKMQEAIVKIEMWANKWGFRFSVGKTNIMLFTRKLERVKLLGAWFHENLT